MERANTPESRPNRLIALTTLVMVNVLVVLGDVSEVVVNVKGCMNTKDDDEVENEERNEEKETEVATKERHAARRRWTW